jgi:excisionase family DNA binding protein
MRPDTFTEPRGIPMVPASDELLDIPALKQRLKLSRSLIYKLIGSGEIPTIKIGKRRLVRPEAVSAWLASKGQRAA